MRLQYYIALLLAVALFVAVGCATTYDGCKDPKSYITFMPQQCHANFNRGMWQGKLDPEDFGF